jgi:hypothetical protein
MSIKRYTNWKGWLEGFYDSWVDAVTGALIAWGGSAGLGQMTGESDLTLNWKQAAGIAVSAMFWSTLRYLQAHKRPIVVEETVDTSFEQKKPDGTTISQSSTTVTKTPITEEKKQNEN